MQVPELTSVAPKPAGDERRYVDRVAADTMPEPQSAIMAPQTRAAIFLVLAVAAGAPRAERVRRTCGGLDKLIRAVNARDADGHLSCVVGLGSAAWDELFAKPRPAGLHSFRELRSGPRIAPSTGGDLLFHIRAERMDLCYELGAQVMAQLGDGVSVLDETHGSLVGGASRRLRQ